MDLVFEIGCEELPAGALKPAVEWMAAELSRALGEARLEGADIKTYATPRRLALVATGIPGQAPDVRKKLQGPPVKAAFGPDGKPTRAGEGFAKKAGVPVSELKVENDRVVVDQELKGQRAAEALPAMLEKIVKGIPFRKSMRWGTNPEAFARPIHWIGAALDGQLLPVKFADVESSLTTRGHRFHGNQQLPLPRAADYVAALRRVRVLADWDERKARVAEEVQRAAKDAGGEPLADEDLLETVTGLVEEPTSVMGSFEKEFLELPPEVLVSEMRGHQKYFAVTRDGKLAPAFVAVSNTRVRDPALSRKGYERVLRSRLSDGKFFFDEDRKVPLQKRVEKLARRTFMAGLGTELERVQRLRELALWLHGATGRGDAALLSQAAELCKADLSTGMVGEFPDLQGVMGRVYALHDGAPAEVALAIFEHYLPRGADERMPSTDTSALLGLADRLDTLVGIFGLGKEPTGTADPYGLRRAALGLLRITLARRYRFDLHEALEQAQRLHQKRNVVEKVWPFLLGRLEVFWKERAAPDSIQAVLHTGGRDVVALEQRLTALHTVREKSRAQFEATAATFKRIANILSQAHGKGLSPMGFHSSVIPADSRRELELADALERSRLRVQTALADHEDYGAAYAVLSELRPAVDGFFLDVMVMDPDARLRDNRLALLRSLHELFAPLADFARLQVTAAAGHETA